MTKKPLRIAVPKGKLQKPTAEFLAKAGLGLAGYGDGTRNYRPTSAVPEVEIKVFGPQEIPILLSRGYYDIGISGLDWYCESRCEKNVAELVDLGYGRVDIVLAIPEKWADVTSAAELFRKFGDSTSGRPLRIWTEYLNLAEEFVFKYENSEPTIVSPYRGVHRERHSGIEIFHSFGATESKPPEDGEAIIDNSETGRTLAANGLKVLHKVLPNSTARLLASRRSLLDREKEDRIEAFRKACEQAAPKAVEKRRPASGHLDW